MDYKYAYLNTLLLLHSAFMLSLVKMLLKQEVGINIVDHGKLMDLCFLISVGTMLHTEKDKCWKF